MLFRFVLFCFFIILYFVINFAFTRMKLVHMSNILNKTNVYEIKIIILPESSLPLQDSELPISGGAKFFFSGGGGLSPFPPIPQKQGPLNPARGMGIGERCISWSRGNPFGAF